MKKFKMKRSVAAVISLNEKENIVNGKPLNIYFYNNQKLINKALFLNINGFFNLTVKGGGNVSQAVAISGAIRAYVLKNLKLTQEEKEKVNFNLVVDDAKIAFLKSSAVKEIMAYRKTLPKTTGQPGHSKKKPRNRR